MTSPFQFTVDAEHHLAPVVDCLLQLIDDGYRLVLFSGDLGAGKTTLVKHLGVALGIGDPISSPTFSLIQEYRSDRIGIVYHMDLYRIGKPDDLVQIGLEEYLDSGNLCLIEWPAVGEAFFDMKRVRVDIGVDSRNIRTFSISTHDTVDA